MVTHANVLANVQNFNFWMRYTEAGVYLHATPIFHIADFPCMFAAPAFGACQVTIPKFDPRRFCEAVDRERVSHTVLVPTMINLLTQFPEVKKYDLSSLQVLAYGGSPMPPDLIRRTRELLPQVKLVQAYGLSESGFLTGLQDQEHTDDRLLICGSQTIQGSRSKLESPASWWLAAPTLCGGTGIIQGRPRLRFEMALFAPETSATRILRGISTFWTG
jgi:acyl-CoA synthetase (AMP-forming)/AMP-acid ligase II